MKKFSLFALAAAGMLLGACSDKDAAQDIQGGQNFTDGAFIGVTLQLPSAQNNSTRANEDFDDGDANEFAVHNAILYIFKGASEDDATFVGQYVIGTGTDWEDDLGTAGESSSPYNVTSTYSKATQISNELAAEMADNTNTANYYAYVIVNNPGVDAVATGATFAQFKARQWNLIGSPVAEAANIGSDGLLMTNAPVCNYAGGSQSPAAAKAAAEAAAAAGTTVDDVAYTTLVKLDKTKVFATEASAIAAPAGCIFIERAAVKISVEATSGAAHVGSSTGPAVTFTNWQIINYPETFYNTRKVQSAWGSLVSYIEELDADGNSDISTVSTSPKYFANWKLSNQYRFVSGTAFNPQLPGSHYGPFRTYFAEDPTYTTDGGLLRPQAQDGHWIAMNTHGYTVENTFDVEHQTWKNTTMVTFKAQIGDGSDFFTVNDADEMFIATAAVGTSGDPGYVPAKTAVENVQEYVQAEIAKLPNVKAALQAACAELAAADVAAWEADPANAGIPSPAYEYGASVTVSVTATAAANEAAYTVNYAITGKNADSQKTKADLQTATATAITNALTAGKAVYKVNLHEDGIAYYNARIQHFGEYETPWSATKPFQTVAPGTTVQQIYGFGANPDLSATRFLGRYGVVRDNWYKLSIDAVKHIGTAEPIDVSSSDKGGTPDDQIENYISVHVHIVPWVIRNQKISF